MPSREHGRGRPTPTKGCKLCYNELASLPRSIREPLELPSTDVCRSFESPLAERDSVTHFATRMKKRKRRWPSESENPLRL